MKKILCENIQNNIYYLNNKQLFLELKTLVEKYPRGATTILTNNLNNKYSYLINWINLVVDKLQSNFYKISTKCNWIFNNITDFPICPICKSNRKYKNINLGIFEHYSNTCSHNCMYNDKARIKKINDTKKIKQQNNPDYFKDISKKASKTYELKTGYKNASQNPEVKLKKQQTYLDHYNTTHNMKSHTGLKEYQDAIFNKYGVYSVFQVDEIKEKTKNTLKTHLSVDYVFQSKECLEKSKITRYLKNNGKYNSDESLIKAQITYFNKTGYKFTLQNPEVQKKIHENMDQINTKRYLTKKKNGTFNTSKPEEETYKLLCEKFGKNNVFRQYKSEKYPFNCDFYIKTQDLYIECNFSWTHGGHWFNESNKNDLTILNKWKEKAKKSNYYKNAIKNWTKRDLEKLAIAKENNLNYLVFWKYTDVKSYIINN